MAIAGTIAAIVSKTTQIPFLFGINTMLLVALVDCWYGNADVTRKALLLTLVVVYLFRMNWVLIVWYNNTAAAKLKTVTPQWQIYLLPVLVANMFGWLYCLPFHWITNRVGKFDNLDFLTVIIYIVGTIVNFGSDYQKNQFKRLPDSNGKILDTGFWKYSRHPNYFGDFLIYLAFGLSAGVPWGLISPLANLAQYIGDVIPTNEKMAAKRYGAAWNDYKKKTKCFIPFIA